jgi:hypothetical protein
MGLASMRSSAFSGKATGRMGKGLLAAAHHGRLRKVVEHPFNVIGERFVRLSMNLAK